MTPQTPGSSSAASGNYDAQRLFIISVIALVTAGMVFSIRAASIPELQKTFFDPIDPTHAAGMIGAVAGVAFLGFAISIFIGSPLCDSLGMGRLLALAAVCFIVGTVTTIFAGHIASGKSIYWVLWFGMLSVGLGHGLVEAVINPLIATLYPEDKTHRLNVLHAWWPAGLIIGGLLSYFVNSAHQPWQIKFALILIPAIAFGVMLVGAKFPPTERVASGVSGQEMWSELQKPMFLLWLFCMFLTAASELAPGQWVAEALTRTVHFEGILLLVYVSGLMFVMRHFAGTLAHKLSPIGLLWVSSLLAGLGLAALSFANSRITGLLAATLWGVGVCYMWPTMLGVTSERFPRGGALLMGLMGTAGNLSIYFVLPKMGSIYDDSKAIATTQLHQQAYPNFDALQKAVNNNAPGADQLLNKVLTEASHFSFLYVAALPAVLLVVFGLLWLRDKSQGGYKAVTLAPAADTVAQPFESGMPAVGTETLVRK